VGARELSLPVEEASGSRLRLGGSNPAFAGEWRRATFTTVSGTVTYRQRSALTREAEVYVDLRDAGAPAEVPPLVRSRIPTPGQVPVAFTLTYDPASLDPSRSYALSARITDRGELRFVTEHPVTLPTAGDAPPVEIVVGPVR
jgi:putative lipoprotein